MKETIKHLKQYMCLLIAAALLVTLLADIPVSAAGKKLPSGIGYDAIGQEVQNYFTEHEATSAGLAYSVFDESGDIASAYLGYADKENGVAVDEDTVFEWGSGSKMLVWVSVMQMVEQGKLDLDEDIRNYLPEGFLTNQKYETPITMIHLMNHTAGFQDTPSDMSIVEDNYLTTLEEAVSAHKPEQIYEPGAVTAYSNWTTSLAAYIVSRLAGMEFTDYVHENIFAPLGMERTAFSSNLHDNEWVKEHRKDLKCYTDTGELSTSPYVYCTLYPSGGCVSTFKDYSLFAKALLDRSDKLMKKETWDLFYSPTDYFGDTDMAKNCHGLWYVYFNASTVGHIGKTGGCSSYILIDPEDHVGAAIICNQGNETTFSEKMMSLFFGDYKASQYYQAESLPAGKFLNAKMVAKGPFKLTGLMGTLSKDMSEEYWTISDDYSPSIMEIAYMDYIEIPAGQTLLETVLFALFGADLAFMVLMLVVRLLKSIIRIAKKGEKHRYPLRTWSIVLSLLTLIVPAAFLMMMTSTLKPAYTYSWIPILICAIAVLQIIMVVYGIIKNLKADIPIGSKIYNWLIIFFTIVTLINICFWNLFMFWKI